MEGVDTLSKGIEALQIVPVLFGLEIGTSSLV